VPARWQKRASARLRTAGALSCLLGLAALWDAPRWGAGFLCAGLLLYLVGRRWM
jgi:hypothetical protein